jgi:predicted RNA polymerase sigma factor
VQARQVAVREGLPAVTDGPYLETKESMAQRISRAKQGIRDSGSQFTLPPARANRLRAVLQVLYLIFNEGYITTAGAELARSDLAAEAIRLTRVLYRLLPDDGEVAGLLALMLLTHARLAARARPDGSLVPLAEQDRGRWTPISSKPPSPPSTTRLRTCGTLIGRRSWPCSGCWKPSQRTRW